MDELVNLIAKKFIARTHRKAIWQAGEFQVVKEAWTREDLTRHLTGEQIWGHYPLSKAGECKLFCLTVYLDEEGEYPWPLSPEDWDGGGRFPRELRQFSPQASWWDRSHESRPWLKLQMRIAAARLCRIIQSELKNDCVVEYGGDGILYVYGLTGLVSGVVAEEGAELTEALYKENEPAGDDLMKKLSCVSVNVESLDDVWALPLSKNLTRENEPVFFVDMSAALTDLQPADPVWALTTDNCFKRKGE